MMNDNDGRSDISSSRGVYMYGIYSGMEHLQDHQDKRVKREKPTTPGYIYVAHSGNFSPFLHCWLFQHCLVLDLLQQGESYESKDVLFVWNTPTEMCQRLEKTD